MSEVQASLGRFTRAERWVHRATGLLMGTCLITAFVLYYGPVSLAVGHRHTVELIHVWAGYALAAPLLLGLASSAYRADLGVLNRFTREDWRWLRSKNRRDGSFEVGKFNAGQKLNAALTAGSIVVLLGTGTLMFWTGLVRLRLAHRRDVRARLVRARARAAGARPPVVRDRRPRRPVRGCGPAGSGGAGRRRSTRRGPPRRPSAMARAAGRAAASGTARGHARRR